MSGKEPTLDLGAQARARREQLRKPGVRAVLLPDGAWWEVAWDRQGHRYWAYPMGSMVTADFEPGTFLLELEDGTQISGPVSTVLAERST